MYKGENTTHVIGIGKSIKNKSGIACFKARACLILTLAVSAFGFPVYAAAPGSDKAVGTEEDVYRLYQEYRSLSLIHI